SRSRLSDPKTVGVVGIALGVLAFVLAIPPVTLRSAVWPVVIGFVALVFGIVAISRGATRVGGGAIAAGIAGTALALLAIQSSVSNLHQVVDAGLIGPLLVFPTPPNVAAVGRVFSER